jgi:hypothetical protein
MVLFLLYRRSDHLRGEGVAGGVPVKIVSEGHAIKAAGTFGDNHGEHEIDRVDCQVADHALEGMPAGNFFRQGKITRGSHVVLAQLGLAGHVGGQEPDLLRKTSSLQLQHVVPRDLDRRTAVASEGLDLLGRTHGPRGPVA